jgi:hypothetical protein
VKFILTLGPGSGADIGARLIAEKLSAKWGQPVVVENRPGGDGFVAITAFTSARDDHTLFDRFIIHGASLSCGCPTIRETSSGRPRQPTLVTIGVPPSPASIR